MSKKMKVFEYVVLCHPTKNEEKEGVKTHLVLDVQTIIAPSEHVANMQIIKEIPEKYDGKLEQLEIAIRPF